MPLMRQIFSKIPIVVSNTPGLSLQFTLILETISQAQLIHLVIATSFSKYHEQNRNFDLFEIITSFTSVSGSFGYFENLRSRTLGYAALSVFAAYFLFQILLFVGMTTQIIKKININPRFAQITANFSIVHSRVFFFLMLYFLLGLLSCNNIFGKDSLTMKGQWDIGISLVALVLSLCNIGFAIIQEFFFYRVNKNKNAYGTKNNHMHKIVLFHKLLGLIAHFFFQNSPLKIQVTSIVHLLLIISSMYILYTKLPFYNTKVLKTVVFLTAINFSFAVIYIIKAFDQELEISASGLLISCLVIVKFHWNYFNKILERTLEGRMDTPEKAIHFVILMKENNLGSPNFPIFKRKFNSTSIFANGYMRKEGIETIQITDTKSAKEYEREAYTYFIKKLTFLLERNPESDVLILYTANLYLKKLGNVFMAANLLEKLKQRNSSIPVKNSVENMEIHLKNVCHRIYANSDYNLELSTYFEFKTKTEAMRKSVDLEASKHIELWQELGSKRPSILRIINISANIDQIELKTLPKFKEYSQGPSSKFASFLLLHANYLQIIKELPHEAIKVFKKIQTQAIIQTETHIFDVNSDEAGVFVFSLNKGRVGTILNVSASTSNLFHFQKSRLVGASLHLLLPKVVADKYIQILENSLREPTCLLKNFKTYAKAKEKEYFEVEIQFQMYPHHFYGLCLLAIFKKVSSAKLVIITDDRNIIQECSKELQETFHFESSANKMHYRLEDILPEFGPATYLLNRAVSNSEHFSHRSSINGHQGIADFIKSCSLFKPSAPEPKTQLDDSINSLTQIKPHNEEVPFVRRRNRTRSHFLTVISSAGIENQALADLYFSNRSEHSNPPDEDDQALARPIKLKFYPLQDKGFPIEYGVRVKKFQFEDRVFKILVLTPLDDDIPKNREQNSPDFGSKPTKNLHDSFADSFPEDEERPDISPSKYEGRQNMEKLDLDPSNRDKVKLLSSRSSRNLSNQFQNILDNKREKGYLPTILNRLDQTEDRSSRGFYMQRVIRSIKTLKSVFGNKESHPLSRLSILFLYFIMMCLVLLAGLNLFLSQDSFHQTSQGLQIVNAANQRLALTVDVWAQLLKILARTTEMVPNYLVAKEYQEAIYTDTIQLIETNNNLYEFFETSSQRTFLDNAFNQDIRFWESVNNQSKNVFEGNTFAATNLLLNKYLTIGNYSDILDLASTQDYLNLLNNTANDYLLSSEEIIETTYNLLDEILGKKQDNLKLVLASTNSGLALMLFIVLALSWRIVQSYKRLFCTLTKIPEKHISQRIEQLEHVRSALKWDINTKEFANNQVQLLNKNTERVKLAQIKSISENNFEETYWIEQTSKYVARYIGVTVFCLLLVSGMFLSALIKTQREFNTLEDVSNQLTVVADGIYQTNMVFGNFYFNVLLQDQSNVYIRNSSPDDQLNYSLSMLNQLNQRLLTAFTTNSDGNNDLVIESILKNNICDLIAMPEQLNGYCENATKSNTLGLLALVSDYYDVSLQYISLYRQNQTLSYAQSLLEPYNVAINTTLPVLQYASKFLISYVLSDLDVQVEEFVQQEVLQFGILIGAIAVCTVLIRVIVLQKLMFLDVGKRRILKNVPYYAIQENRFLKFYLVREFNKELLAIKNIL